MDISSETGKKKLGSLKKIGLLQNGPAHWRPKPWGHYLGTRAQPGPMSSRPRGPLPSNARGEKSVPFFRAFFRVSGKQFRSLADRWRFSAIGHAGPLSCKGSAGAYLILCSHTALCSEWSRGEEHLTVCPASSKKWTAILEAIVRVPDRLNTAQTLNLGGTDRDIAISAAWEMVGW